MNNINRSIVKLILMNKIKTMNKINKIIINHKKRRR